MANICDNKFYIYCDSESVIEKIIEKLDTLFEDTLDGEISYATENAIEGYFDSRWAFPEDIFNDFFQEFDDDSLYMRCLSEEYGCGLVSMNIYVDGQWKNPQCFDLY
jgi:hypothetical protein